MRRCGPFRWIAGVAVAFGLVDTSSFASAQALVTTSSLTAALPSGGDHQVRIEALQSQLDSLTGRLDVVADQVALLSETALGGTITETGARIVHKNALRSSFVLERARYILDGGILLDRTDDNGSLADADEIVLFDGGIEPGDHVLEVEIVCRGGGFGLFSYVESYRFRVSSRYTLRVREGRIHNLNVEVYQIRNITVAPAKRLSVRYDLQVGDVPPAGVVAVP